MKFIDRIKEQEIRLIKGYKQYEYSRIYKTDKRTVRNWDCS